MGCLVVRRTMDFPLPPPSPLRRQWGLWDPERHRPSSTFHATPPRAVLHGPLSSYHNGRWRRMAQRLFGEAACGDIHTVSEAVTDTTLDTMALPAVRAYLDSISLSDPDLLMSIAETVDEWKKGVQAFEAVATCPVGTFASLQEHLLNHRRLVLDLGPATFDKVLFDFRVRSPSYAVDAASSATSVASPSSALPRTLPGRLMPDSTSLRHSVLHPHECDLRDFWLRRLGILRSRAAAYVELQDRYCQVRMYLS